MFRPPQMPLKPGAPNRALSPTSPHAPSRAAGSFFEQRVQLSGRSTADGPNPLMLVIDLVYRTTSNPPRLKTRDVARMRLTQASLSEELLSQRSRRVGLLVTAPALKFGYEEVDDGLEGLGANREGEIEAVEIGVVEPGLKLIRDGLG